MDVSQTLRAERRGHASWTTGLGGHRVDRSPVGVKRRVTREGMSTRDGENSVGASARTYSSFNASSAKPSPTPTIARHSRLRIARSRLNRRASFRSDPDRYAS